MSFTIEITMATILASTVVSALAFVKMRVLVWLLKEDERATKQA